MALAELITRHWMACTDNSSEQVIAEAGPEALYRLGFTNALQTVGQTTGQDEIAELLAAIREAVALEAD